MDKAKLAGIASVIAVVTPLVTLLATSGEKVLAVLGGIPKVLSAWSSGLPMGAGSFFLALALATLLWLWLLPWLPKARDGAKPHLSANLIAVAAAVFVTDAQQYFAAHGNGEILRATIVGLIAGMLASYVGLAIRSLLAKRAAQPLPPPVCK